MRKVLVGVTALVVLAGASALSYWAGSRQSPPASSAPAAAAPAKGAPPPGIVVEATRVSVVKLPQALAAVGSLRSDETVILRPGRGRVANQLPRRRA